MIGQGASQYGQGAAPSEICLAGTLSFQNHLQATCSRQSEARGRHQCEYPEVQGQWCFLKVNRSLILSSATTSVNCHDLCRDLCLVLRHDIFNHSVSKTRNVRCYYSRHIRALSYDDRYLRHVLFVPYKKIYKTE